MTPFGHPKSPRNADDPFSQIQALIMQDLDPSSERGSTHEVPLTDDMASQGPLRTSPGTLQDDYQY